MLVISCPHALGLAIPLTTSISSALAARNGILVKDRLALEQSRTVDAFLFDKTGTLTKGQHTVVGVAGAGIDEDEVLRLAGGVESDSEHPLARAIVTAARDRGDIATAEDFRSITGRGVEATIDGTAYAVGGPALLRERSLTEPAELTDWSQHWRDRGASVLYLVRGDAIVGGVALEDEVRPEARHAVAELQAMGRRVVMITGDARQVAEAVGTDLGVDEVMAEVLPEDKDAKVAELQARGLKVAMVGDGVNDAPALARADVGIAIGAGTDVAIESAGLILASSDPRAVVGIIRLSKAAYRKSLQNLWWAAGYNVARHPPRRRRPRLGRHHHAPRRRRRPDERLHHRRGPQRPAPAPRSSSAPRPSTNRPPGPPPRRCRHDRTDRRHANGPQGARRPGRVLRRSDAADHRAHLRPRRRHRPSRRHHPRARRRRALRRSHGPAPPAPRTLSPRGPGALALLLFGRRR